MAYSVTLRNKYPFDIQTFSNHSHERRKKKILRKYFHVLKYDTEKRKKEKSEDKQY